MPDKTHKWFFVNFNYAGWTECECGFRPVDQAEYDDHTEKYGIENAA